MRRPSLSVVPDAPLPTSLVLREATLADENGLAELLQSAFDRPWTSGEVAEALTRNPEVRKVFVVADGDRLVGTASARIVPEQWPHGGYLHWVGVRPSARCLGVGRAVSCAALRYFHDVGCRYAVLETDPERLPALRLYLRLGFVPAIRHEADPQRWQSLLTQIREMH